MAKLTKKAKRLEKRQDFRQKIEKVAKERTRGGARGGGTATRTLGRTNLFSKRQQHSVLLLGSGSAGGVARPAARGKGGDGSDMLSSLLELEQAMDDEVPAAAGRAHGRRKARMSGATDWSSDSEVEEPSGAAALRQAPATTVRATVAQQREALSLASAVKAHPAYRQNPFAALRQHVANFVALEEEESGRAQQQAIRQARAISRSDRARARARQTAAGGGGGTAGRAAGR
eukprot:CAMPEP_0170741320 /NCGR_PEP_ID=MMETSP0437-20130122/6156_1 /TAXON_ID=0 /ORGANISM="Sexangularia sp." /LENGTH=230 /DNA_ID=CAMNT_0011079883 /DNA_START=81 /DNA_END=776 /DNA_ORIENTATION=+